MPGLPTIIHWFRRDLRLQDHPSLARAAESNFPLVPVYILSDWHETHQWTGPNRQQFLCESLAELAENLASRGSKLIIRRGDAVHELRRLVKESHAVAIHFQADPDPFGKSQEQAVGEMCAELGIPCHAHAGVAMHGPHEVLTQGGTPYRVFTPFCRNWMDRPKPSPEISKIHFIPTPPLRSLALPTVQSWGLEKPFATLLTGGEAAAKNRLATAIAEKITHYDARRDLPAADGTSRLSQDLRWGLLSIRTVFAAAMTARSKANTTGKKGIDTFLKELAWREFYFSILHHFPNVLDEEFNPVWRGLPWDEPGERLELWKQGRTGFPIVDAGMRELSGSGFMQNRVRMITAMFLTKDLHIDWKLGESWFMQNLVDGEIASNNGGWQWSAGTGADAAPYFRIQNPWSQTARYDANGLYIKRWVPELIGVSPRLFQGPPAAGKSLATGYPLPCVDHKTERERTLKIFSRHRAGGK
jgi:deoxyribodipyrimidine photo-lyase